MGYLFENIGQLAGFFLNQGPDESLKIKGQPNPEVSFDSVLKSQALTKEENPLQDIGSIGLNGKVEFVERKTLNADVIKALLEHQGKIVTLEIPSQVVSHFLDDLSFPAIAGKTGWAPNSVFYLDSAVGEGSTQIGKSAYQISFNISDFFSSDQIINNESIPIELSGAGLQKSEYLINMAELISLINDYPDPIQAQVDIFPEEDVNELKCTFRFDLRNLFEPDDLKSSKPVEGLLSLSSDRSGQGMVPASGSGVTRYNNEKGGTALIHLNNFREGCREIFPSNINPEVLFPPNDNTLISLLNLKNQPSHSGISGRHGDHVVASTLNEFESTGAGEVKIDNKDNSSALSRVSAGSDGASENLSILPIADGDMAPGITGQSAIYRAGLLENSLGGLENLKQNRFENIENIKASILNSIAIDRSTVRMRLYPENLGSLHIKLHWKAGVLMTEFRVENVRAADAMSAILPELKTGLEEANLRFGDIRIIVENHGKEFSPGGRSQYHFGASGYGGGGSDRQSNKNNYGSDAGIAGDNSGKIPDTGSISIHRGWIDLKA